MTARARRMLSGLRACALAVTYGAVCGPGLHAACGGDDGAVDTASDSDAADTSDAREVVTPDSPWSIVRVMAGGRQVQAAVAPDGALAVAAYAEAGTADGLCGEGADSGERTRWALRYAAKSGATSATWASEEVAGIVHLGPPRGFDLAFAPDGVPHIAALAGEPIPFYCGANDLALYTRDASAGGGAAAAGAWTSDVVVAESNEAMTGEPASDFGTVVGLWPALAYAPDGGAVLLYKDVHGGGLQADDFRRADLELALGRPGAWTHRAVDWGAGAGDFNQVAIDPDGRLVAIMFHPRDELIDSLRGLWALRSDDDGATWQRVRLFAGGIAERPSLALDGGGTPHVAWYDGELGLPYVARLDDDARFDERDAWDIGDVGDHVYDEGRNPTLAVSAAGKVALVYQRCGRASDGLGDCSPDKDAVVFAWQDGDVWEREVVEEEGDGICGASFALVFVGEAPTAFYPCTVDDGSGTFATELRAATRRAL